MAKTTYKIVTSNGQHFYEIIQADGFAVLDGELNVYNDPDPGNSQGELDFVAVFAPDRWAYIIEVPAEGDPMPTKVATVAP